jgi:ubiquinone/menaquinone biosynthesis C-methylase UbiE
MDLTVRRIINSLNYRVIGPLTRRDARNWATKTDFVKTHRRQFKTLRNTHSLDEAARLVVGGDYEGTGLLSREMLIYHGLRETDYLIDVGCGSGRLAKPLSTYLTGKYLGIDVVPELVEYARRLVARPDWRFEHARGLAIPENDQQADMVCFISVLTHLLHEESFVYLRDAKRVLKPGGKIVLSFLDFRMPTHWYYFQDNLKDIGKGSQPMNVFMCADLLREWARHLELEVESIHEGEEPYIPFSKNVTVENGILAQDDRVAFGQSVCVMVRR